jgi:hypothetical protein
MQWAGFIVLTVLGAAYFALALTAPVIMSGVGYTLAALLWLIALANLYKPRK